MVPTDSITAGAHSSGGNHPYPQQLQLLLDPTQYTVTNLGACGSTCVPGARWGHALAPRALRAAAALTRSHTPAATRAAPGSMQKNADSPYWQRPQFKALTSAKWDVIVIM